MSAHRSPFWRSRLILDCTLVILIILIGSASYLSMHDNSVAQTSAQEALVSGALPLINEGLVSAQPAAASPAVDDATLAAMIAAENAALTPPIYFTELPLVIR